MSSRFFAGGSDSESSSSEEEELYSEEEESQEEESEDDSEDDDDSDDSSDDSDDGVGAKRFLKGDMSDDESDEDDGAKVLKSAKDKRFEELEGTIRSIENAEKINDWAVIQERESFVTAACRDNMLTCTARVRQAEPPGSCTHPPERWPRAQGVHPGYRRSRDHHERDAREAEGHPQEDERH